MTIVTLTFTRQHGEVISGIPAYVAITANIPAMIFYTLDGSLPTVFSTQYDGYAIQMPTDSGRVTLSAVGYFLDGYGALVPSSVLSVDYYTDNTFAGEHVRRNFFNGITYMYPGGLDIPFWYDGVTGAPTVFLDVPINDFRDNTIVSDRDADGTTLPNSEVSVKRIPPDETASSQDQDYTLYDSPSNGGIFDPKARVIIIDGRVPRDTRDVFLINGPFMTLREPERYFGGVDFISTQGTNYVSGSLIKAHYDRRRGIIVFYYFDSNTGRQVKSIQNLPEPAITPRNNAVMSNPVVFKWNNWGRHQAV